MKQKNENLPKPTFKLQQDFDFMNQGTNPSDINNTNNLTDMMNNLSLEQMNNENQNFSPFNLYNNDIGNNNNNNQMMNMNNWDDGSNDFMNQFNKQNMITNNK